MGRTLHCSNDLLRIVDIPKLEERRLCQELFHVCKIIQGICYFTPDIHVIKHHVTYSIRLAKPQTLHCPFTHPICYNHSFVPSSMRAWNSFEEQHVLAAFPFSKNFFYLIYLHLSVHSIYIIRTLVYFMFFFSFVSAYSDFLVFCGYTPGQYLVCYCIPFASHKFCYLYF